MTTFPTEAEIEVAFALLGKLVNRGADPRLNADGTIQIHGLATPHESAWTREHKDAFRAALVGSGRYAKGSLDRIYGIGRGGAS